MSKHNRPRLSLPGDRSEPITAPTDLPPEGTKRLIQEKQMEVVQEAQVEKQPEASQEPQGPTAKQMALIEEANAKRIVDQQRANEQRAAAESRPVENIMGLAAKGRDALLQGLRQHAQQAAPPPYVPPPMTERQRASLQEEMEAGARRVATAEAQKIRAGHPTLPPPADNNEGLSNPVHRPGDLVPDPTIDSKTGYLAGTKRYSPDV